MTMLSPHIGHLAALISSGASNLQSHSGQMIGLFNCKSGGWYADSGILSSDSEGGIGIGGS